MLRTTRQIRRRTNIIARPSSSFTTTPTLLARGPLPVPQAQSRPRLLSTMAPIPSTMKAVQIDQTGGLEAFQYRDVPLPQLKEGQVLVRNDLAGINYIDTYYRSGLYPLTRFPCTLGRDAVGEVIAAHPSVTDQSVKPGTRVVYMLDDNADGTYAQYTSIGAKEVVPVPGNVPSDVALAAYVQGLTAWTFIREAADVKEGQWTLVHAAAGGVGIMLVQMLRSVGARIIATASSDEKLALAKENGAGWTINSSADVVAQVKEITGGHGIDAIFDGVGKDTFEADLEMIARKGTLISLGNASGAVPPFSILRLGAKNVKLMRPKLNAYLETREEIIKYSSELFDLIGSGKVKTKIHAVYPLADVAKAHADIQSRKTTGKLLLKCN